MAQESSKYSSEKGFFTPFKGIKYPWFDLEIPLSAYQRNIELMTSTQKITAEALQSIFVLQNQYAKDTFDLCNEQIKCWCSTAPFGEKTARHSEVAKAAIEKSIEHAKNINDVIVKSNVKINESLQTGLKEGFTESRAKEI